MGWFDWIPQEISKPISDVVDWGGQQATDIWHGVSTDPMGSLQDALVEPLQASIARPTSWLGDTMGLNELSGTGDFLGGTFDNPWFKKGMLAAATYGAGSALGAADAAGSVAGGEMLPGAVDAGWSTTGTMAAGEAGADTLAGSSMLPGAIDSGWSTSGLPEGITTASMMDPSVAGWSTGTDLLPSGMAPVEQGEWGLNQMPGNYTPPNDSLLGGMGDWWKKQSGLSKLMMGMGGAGLLSNLTSGYMRADQQGKENQNVANALNNYFKETSWTPERRESTMKGVMGQVNQMIAGQQRRAGAAGADAGRGGGFYGSSVERAREAGRETAATTLAKTFAPPNYSPEAFIAQGKAQTSPVSPWYDFSQGLGNTAGKWPYLALMDKFLS